MHINSYTPINILIDKDNGNYISIRKNGDELNIISTSKKPRGGAKSTLKKIQQILEVVPLESDEKATLANLSKDIEQSYDIKNAKKNALKRFIHRKHTRKVHQLAARIAQLSYQPEVPMDALSIIGGYLDVKTLAALSRTSKAADSNVGWLVKAEELGWERTQDVEAAKGFIKNLISALKAVHMPALPKRIRKTYQPVFTTHELSLLLNLSCYYQHSVSQNLSLLHFLSKKTQVLKDQNFLHPYSKHIIDKLYSVIPSNPESLVAFAQLANNLGLDIFTAYQPKYIVEETNISSDGAGQVLDICSPNVDYTLLLSAASSVNHLGWAKALVKKQPHTEVNICPRTKEMLTLFLEAGLTFPKSDLFLGQLIKTASAEVILDVLDLFKDEERDVKFLMMNNRRAWDNLPNANLYELAQHCGLPSFVLRKLDPKLTHF